MLKGERSEHFCFLVVQGLESSILNVTFAMTSCRTYLPACVAYICCYFLSWYTKLDEKEHAGGLIHDVLT